jgi:hypothetical protein
VSPSRPSFSPQLHVYQRAFCTIHPLFSTTCLLPAGLCARLFRKSTRWALQALCASVSLWRSNFFALCFHILTNCSPRLPTRLLASTSFVLTAIPIARGREVRSSACSRHSPLATFFYLPLESTLVNVQQNKGLYPPLESTLMQNRGRGSRLSPLVLIHTFNLSEARAGSISRSARFLPHAPARYMLGASPTMRFP